jgi:hypothetical protein
MNVDAFIDMRRGSVASYSPQEQKNRVQIPAGKLEIGKCFDNTVPFFSRIEIVEHLLNE